MKQIKTIGIVGAGAMGRGIAQIAAQAGFDVRLFDLNAQAVAAARDNLSQTWDKLAAKGKITAQDAEQALSRIRQCADLNEMRDADLVIEAVVERLDVKTELFRQLESIVSPDCLLVSNTSSLSITAIAQGCERPGR
ncbi:MAG TPA: 3-hydroxyacyl-CoA dehydrogenase NAD-binding domain-containing protein, partial [Burkholderiaceae bacterium]|nr:3-hydroxyacyl-CoA dehydrogenase NAD-binding domain-containing protein [Burkholderiaceae bacterium]